jgi:hypothetical protein
MLTLGRLLMGGMVDIYVGPSKKLYQLHKALVCARSSFKTPSLALSRKRMAY